MEIIYSADFSLINLKVNLLTKRAGGELTALSFVDDSWPKILGVLTTTSFNLEPAKTVVIRDAFFLVRGGKVHESFDKGQFWNLMSRIPKNITIILTVVSSKITNDWPKNVNPIIHEEKQWSRAQLKNYLDKKTKPDLDPKAIAYFLDNFLPVELQRSINEIEKINNLFTKGEVVNLEQLKNVILTPVSFNIFDMGSSFVNQDLNQFLVSLNKGFNHDVNGQQLIGLLAKQLISLHWYFKYKKLKLDDLTIAKRLSLNPYYLKQLVANNHQQVGEINDRISNIYSLNKKILSGVIDRKIIPEYLFLKMFPQRSEREKNGTN